MMEIGNLTDYAGLDKLLLYKLLTSFKFNFGPNFEAGATHV